MSVIARTCDRCAQFAEDCIVEDEAYICGECRAEIAEEEAEVEALRQQLRGAVEALRAIAEDRVSHPGGYDVAVPTTVQAYAQGALSRLGGQ